MTKSWFWSALLTLTVTAALQGQSREALLKAVEQTSKWTPVDKPVSYDEKNIEELVGKRAAAITRYGLTGVTIQNLNGADGSVRLTLYQMFDSTAAYGLFTLERSPAQAGFATIPVGTEGFRVGNRSEFWQSKYVVKLEGSAPAVESLAKTVSENIFGQSRKPPVSTHLPPANLIAGSERYVVDPTGIGRELNLDPQKLGFDDSVEAAIADYRIGGKTAHLVLLMYPTQQLAKKYEDQWKEATPDDESYRKRVSALLGLVRGSKDPELAKAILDGMNYETQVTWDRPRPDISLPEVILTIFTFIGVALLFTVVVGVGFGGLRIFVKARYPNRVFDRREDMEVIQLKLAQGVIRKELGE